MQFAVGLTAILSDLPKEDFVACWSALAYLNPGLHPDGYEDEDSGWPEDLKLYAAEAWRREEAGEMTDEEMYPSDASWAGVYDQMDSHTQEETDRRFDIAAGF